MILVLQAFGNDLQCERLTESDLKTVLPRFNTSNTNLNFQSLQSLGNGLRILGEFALYQRVLESSFPLVNSQNIEDRLLLNIGNTILSQAQGIANLVVLHSNGQVQIVLL